MVACDTVKEASAQGFAAEAPVLCAAADSRGVDVGSWKKQPGLRPYRKGPYIVVGGEHDRKEALGGDKRGQGLLPAGTVGGGVVGL
jgi:hypothetical protein